MNLGNATLRSVSVGRPDITQPPSRQSVAASDDYFSLDENASNASDHESEAATVVRYETPQSRVRSPVTSREDLQAAEPGVSTPRQIEAEHDEREHLQAAPIAPSSAEGPREMRAFPLSESSAEASRRTREATARSESPSPGLDDTPYIRYALHQITRQASDPELQRLETSSSDDIYVSQRLPPPGTEGYPPVPDAGSSSPRDLEQGVAPPAGADPGVFIPADPPQGSLRYHNLCYVPAILRPLALGSILLLHLLMIAGLIFCGVWSTHHQGLWNYTGADGPRYFVFEFLPQILAAVLLLLILTVQGAAVRVLPFLALASRGSRSRSGALLMDLFPSHFILPYLSAFRAGNGVLGCCFVIFWISLFAMPLQSSVFQVHYVTLEGQAPTWRWVTVQPVVWTLVAIYALVALALLAMMVLLIRRRTGLMWDPTSLADIVCMLHRSNTLDDFSNVETLSKRNDYAAHLASRHDRLSYWTTHAEESNLFYALGEAGAPPSQRSSRQTNEKLREQRSMASLGLRTDSQGLASSTDHSYQARIYSPSTRYQYIPWFLRDTFVVAWAVTAWVLLIAFLVVSFVNRAVEDGFKPLLYAGQDPAGFSAAGFLYSFIPSLVGLVLFVLWQSLDMHFRALQPFSNMSNPQGASAEDSLLLDYPSRLPVEVTITALAAGHYRVAWISFVSLLSLTFPVLGGGVFWAIDFPAMQQIRMVARMPAFYTMTVFLALYALSFVAIWPTQKRYLPHGIRSLAEIIAFVYQSLMVDDVAFRDPRSKTDLVTKLLGPSPSATQPARYAFGIYKGRDRKEHLGIDRLHRPNSEMVVTTGR